MSLMSPPPALVAVAPPAETTLLDFLRARVSREMIHEICLNDWARDVDLHESEVMKQLSPSPVLGLLPWHPREVFELERWTEPDEATGDIPSSGSAGHLKRLFACTILLRNVAFVSPEDGDGEFFIAISAATVIQLVRSSIALGSQASRLALGFLLWLHGKQSNSLLRPFVSFGVMLLQIQEDLGGTSLLETCAWVERDEKLAREQLDQEDVHSAKWLVGLNYQEDAWDRPKPWAYTLAHVIAARSGKFPPEVESALHEMHDRLSITDSEF